VTLNTTFEVDIVSGPSHIFFGLWLNAPACRPFLDHAQTSNMRGKSLTAAITILALALNAKSQDTLVSAFFGLDNALPGLMCNQPGSLLDGMPVNFRFPLDPSSLAETDFEVVDSLGNTHTPGCVFLAPADEDGENRTVLLLGEFGTASTNPPVEVRIVGDLLTAETFSGESACSEIINLNGLATTNVVPLDAGPSLFFAQRIEGNLNECTSGTQTIQVAWNGGVTPYIDGDAESDLFQYYVGYSDSAGDLIPHVPISIADIEDNDNFHQLCFATSDEIVQVSMVANTVEDPNHDPNAYSEIEVSSCTPASITEEHLSEPGYAIYPNPFSDQIFVQHLTGNEHFILRDGLGRTVMEGRCSAALHIPDTTPGIYYLTILNNTNQTTFKVFKR